MNKYDHVIWDFNGTLLDDVMTGIDSVNTLLEQRGLSTIDSVERYRSVFRFPIIEYYKALGFDFNKESYEAVAPLWVAEYLENVKSAKLYDDVLSTIDALDDIGVAQSVLSATELSMLKGQICALGLDGRFCRVLGLDNIHAGSKLALAKIWREDFPRHRALFIGDTDHDVQTAKTLGADCVLVCRGHQSKEYLSTLGVPVLDDLSTIIDIIKA